MCTGCVIPEVSGKADDSALQVDIHDGTVADVPLANLRPRGLRQSADRVRERGSVRGGSG